MKEDRLSRRDPQVIGESVSSGTTSRETHEKIKDSHLASCTKHRSDDSLWTRRRAFGPKRSRRRPDPARRLRVAGALLDESKHALLSERAHPGLFCQQGLQYVLGAGFDMLPRKAVQSEVYGWRAVLQSLHVPALAAVLVRRIRLRFSV